MKLQDCLQIIISRYPSSSQAARALRIDKAYLHRLLYGGKTNPSKEVLRKLGLVAVLDYKFRLEL